MAEACLGVILVAVSMVVGFLVVTNGLDTCHAGWDDAAASTFAIRGAFLLILVVELVVGWRWAVFGNGPLGVPGPMLTIFTMAGFPAIVLGLALFGAGIAC